MMAVTQIIAEYFPSLIEKELQEEIAKNAIYKEMKLGTILMDIGSYITSVPLLVDGLIRISREDIDGNELFLYYLEGGQTCAMSLTCCMEAEQSNIRAIAETDCEMLFVPVNFMDEWMLKYRSWKNFVMKSYSMRFEEMLHTIDSIAFENLDDRLYSYLKNRATSTGMLEMTITHQQIALDLNSSREAISRLLKKLEQLGKLKLSRNKVRLILE